VVADFVGDCETKTFQPKTRLNPDFTAVLPISDDPSIGSLQTTFFDRQPARFERKSSDVNVIRRRDKGFS
ncbi:MAG: hypothetical protein WB607_08095, partial [Candidatus Acidiferrum sp.]